MAVTSWNDAEDMALQGLTTDAQVIYLRGLRRYMDYSTGIVGRYRRISYRMLAELLEHLPDQHSSAKARRSTTITIDYLRARLRELQRAGLVNALAKQQWGHLVFSLPMAHTGSVRPNSEPQENTKVERQPERQEESSNIQRVSSAEHHQEHQPPRGQSTTHPGSGSTDRQTDPRAHAHEGQTIGAAIRFLADNGVPHSWLIRPDDRAVIGRLIEAGAQLEHFQLAVEKARVAKRGQPFGVFYLQPIVLELLGSGGNPNGGRDAARPRDRQSVADRAAEAGRRYLDEVEAGAGGDGERIVAGQRI
ncbi:hypothetical protein [Thioalbus denitrificans]|uniref:hypothetical protein n=1 Tax=Thioalbus denitrificans TaxID=547122 RepID=UPI000DF368CE|nr:hypothetical protein [Thioalbus denitrificans]